MKKWIKLFGIAFCLIVGMTIFSACDLSLDNSSNNDGTPPETIIVPTEIEVTGYTSEIEVGEDFIDNLKVKAKFDGVWQEVVRADYIYACEYTGSKYGEYEFSVYLKDYPSVEHNDTIIVNPKTIVVPDTFSTVYTGENIDIKTHYEDFSNGLYEVINYVNMSTVGNYEVSLKLTDVNKYVWVDTEGNQLKNPTQKVQWSITKASPKTYVGETSFVAYYGDTLHDIVVDNGLNFITWYRDAGNNVVNSNTLVSGVTNYYAYYNESPQNYEDTLITINISEFITTANYKVEYYKFDGSEYVLDNELSQIISGNIGDIVEIEIEDIDGYEFNVALSNVAGKIVKHDGLILKLYYDITE